jgi:hypothetical protein
VLQRVLDVFQLLIYLSMIAVLFWVGSVTVATMNDIRSDLKQGQIKHDQMLRDHRKFMEKY